MNDKKILLKEIDKYYKEFKYYNFVSLIDIFEELKDDKKATKILLNNNLGLLGNLLYKYKDNKEISDYIYIKEKEIILEALKQNRNLLQYASNELKNDKEVVLEAVKQNGLALEYVPDKLRKLALSIINNTNV